MTRADIELVAEQNATLADMQQRLEDLMAALVKMDERLALIHAAIGLLEALSRTRGNGADTAPHRSGDQILNLLDSAVRGASRDNR